MIEIRRGVIVSSQLAPPAIPTGRLPNDTCGIIGEKTDVYLDICSEYALGQIYMFGWGLFFWVGGVSSFIMGGVKNLITSNIFIIFSILFLPIFIGMIWALLKKPPPPKIRFNRQRRELYIRSENKYTKIVWEDIGVKTITTRTASQYGKLIQSALVFTIPDSFASTHNKEKVIFSVFCGTPEAGIMQWEYIRTFMEIGPDHCPESTLYKKSLNNGEIGTLFSQFKSKDIKGIFWTVFRIITLGSVLVDLHDCWKFSHPIPISAPEVIDWSAPISEDNWCIRSEKLNKSINEAQLLIETKGDGVIRLTNE